MKRRNRNWNMIRRELDTYRMDYQQGTIDTYGGKLTYLPPAHWHKEDCQARETRFEPGRGYNGFRCQSCGLRFALFLQLDKRGDIRDYSAHRQFDYSKAAADAVELKFAARRAARAVNPLGDQLAEALSLAKAKNLAAENGLLLHDLSELLEKHLLGSPVFHQSMKEVPALLAEARA